MQGNLPPEAQEKLEELQDLQEKAQQVAAQKQQAETQLQEAQTALEELEDIGEDAGMYRRVGELLVQTEHGEARDDLEETVENYRDRDQRDEADMSAPINRVRSELRETREEYEEEMQRLQEDEQVVPDEPELINTAVVIGL